MKKTWQPAVWQSPSGPPCSADPWSPSGSIKQPAAHSLPGPPSSQHFQLWQVPAHYQHPSVTETLPRQREAQRWAPRLYEHTWIYESGEIELTFNNGMATFPRKSALRSRSSSYTVISSTEWMSFTLLQSEQERENRTISSHFDCNIAFTNTVWSQHQTSESHNGPYFCGTLRRAVLDFRIWLDDESYLMSCRFFEIKVCN